MDHQWRPTQVPQGNSSICPICSIPHFPFCPPYPHAPPPPPPPPPPPYHQNPRFPPYPDYARPDLYHSGSPANYMPPPPPQPDSWHRNPNFGYAQEYPQSTYGYNGTSNGFVSEVDNRSYKRPRVNDIGIHNAISLDDERRLKLIRDHGGGRGNFANAPSFHGKVSAFDDNDAYNPFHLDKVRHVQMNQGYSDHLPFEVNHQNLPQFGVYNSNEAQGGSLPRAENRVFGGGQAPAPPPPPPLPVSPPPQPPPPLPEQPIYSSPSPKTLFPVPISASGATPYLHNKPTSAGFVSEEWQASSRQSLGEGQGPTFMPKQLSPDKPTIVDASHLFKQPHRITRPDHFVVILRGLPGSGKSYLAKLIRDLEVESGGDAPRIHSMDDYFMTEVEKVEESDASISSSSGRSKKQTVKKVMEYCYEPDMEEAYRESMLKAFKRTLEEGNFTFVIVDDRNLRVADFAQFWAIAKRSGYEVYICDATYKDPVGCAARNVHGFTLDEIQKMAGQWEESPSLYLQLDIKSLFHGDDLKKSGIQEVDMDTEDGDFDNNSSQEQDGKPGKAADPSEEDDAPRVPSKEEKRWNGEEDHPVGVRELGKSKWSEDVDEDDAEVSESAKGNLSALSGLIHSYGKHGKSVHWSDQGGSMGFSIGAAKKANMRSLVIGPGSGYNLKSNPLPDEESLITNQSNVSGRQSIFQERLRAEHESFKAVFDRRRQRIGGLGLEDEE